MAADNPGLVVITWRQELPELAAIGPPRLINHPLDHLDDSAGTELLKHVGVHGRERELIEAIREVGGAPKACLGLTAPWTWRGLSSIQYAKLHSQELRLSPGQ